MRIFKAFLIASILLFGLVPRGSEVAAKPNPVVEFKYDDGTAEGWDVDTNPVMARAVRFTVSAPVQLRRAKIFLNLMYAPGTPYVNPLEVHVWNSSGSPVISPIRIEDLQLDCESPANPGWLCVNLVQYNLVLSGAFYIGVSWPLSSPGMALLGVDMSQGGLSSFLVDRASGTFYPASNSRFVIRAQVTATDQGAPIDITGTWAGSWVGGDLSWGGPISASVTQSSTLKDISITGSLSLSVCHARSGYCEYEPWPPFPPDFPWRRDLAGPIAGTIVGNQITFRFTDVVYGRIIDFVGTIYENTISGISAIMGPAGPWGMTRQ